MSSDETDRRRRRASVRVAAGSIRRLMADRADSAAPNAAGQRLRAARSG
jgi:hypothetical protein